MVGMICQPALVEIGLTDQPKTGGGGGHVPPCSSVPTDLEWVKLPSDMPACHFFVLSRDLHCFESTVGNEKL